MSSYDLSFRIENFAGFWLYFLLKEFLEIDFSYEAYPYCAFSVEV